MTIIPFTPNNNQSPPFQAIFTLDGVGYNVSATWNVYAQRWYLNIADASGNIVWTGALVGSPLNFDIYLALGIFTTSTIVYRIDSGNFEVTP